MVRFALTLLTVFLGFAAISILYIAAGFSVLSGCLASAGVTGVAIWVGWTGALRAPEGPKDD